MSGRNLSRGRQRPGIWLGCLALAIGGSPNPCSAQLIPDATLGHASTLNSVGSQIRIEGGVQVGTNLFHSFQDFNVELGHSVYFVDPGVRNILGRVTGVNPSTINGQLGVTGTANLFLLNPNGIVFGSGASLDIRGSFVATTARAIQFSDGQEFGAMSPQMPELLAIAVPVGLQRGEPEAPIVNRGALQVGQNLTLAADQLDLQGQLRAGQDLTLSATHTVQVRDTITAPFLAQAGRDLLIQGDRGIDILALNHSQWLPFQSGGQLSLISDGVISGDAHFASRGGLQIRSVSGGLATFTSLYDPIITAAGDVDLATDYIGASLLIEAGGNIRIQGNVGITAPDEATPFVGDDAVLNRQPGLILRSGQVTRRYAANSGTVPGSTTGFGLVPEPGITVQGTVFVAPGGLVRLLADNGGLTTQTVIAPAGEITLTSDRTLTTNGQLDVGTAIGSAGAIHLTSRIGDVATGNLLADSQDDAAAFDGGVVTIDAGGAVTVGSILTTTDMGDGGSLRIAAGAAIRADDIITYSYLGGNSGRVTMQAGQDITLANIDTTSDGGQGGAVSLSAGGNLLITGIVDTGVYNAGRGGDIAVSARSLFLNNGAQLRSISNYGGSGDSGNITVDVIDTVSLAGVGPGGTPSAIFSLVDLYSTGNGGDVTIRTGSLQMRDGSEILANHFGEGTGTRAGNITIRARDGVSLAGFRVRLAEGDSPGTGIASNVSFGGVNKQGGTVDIQAGSLELLNGGYISSSLERRAKGQGGNIQLTIGRPDAPGSIVIAGSATRESGILTRTEATSEGGGGNIRITAGDVELRSYGRIGAETNTAGDGGQINLNVASLSVNNRSTISAETFASGNAGAITVQGDRLAVAGGSQIRTSTTGAGRAGAIALGTLARPIGQVTLTDGGSAILADTETASSGDGGSITLFADTIDLTNRARIAAETFGQGNAGTVTVRANQAMALKNASISSSVTSGATGNGGEIDVAAQWLTLTERGRIQSLTLGPGNAGDIQVRADAIAIADPFSGIISGSSDPIRRGNGIGDGGNIRLTANQLRIFNDGIVSASTFSDGRSGNIDVVANTLELTSQGKLSATTQSRGDAGSITVMARDRTLISGAGSGLFANTTERSSGDGGSIFLTTGYLQMQDRARITVNSEGSGRGGDIQLSASRVDLSDRATVLAETASTQGGNIQIQARDLLLLRRNSLISATAGTAQADGNGGNVRINADFVVAVLGENSDIIANAFTGQGGRVDITAKGIWGLQFQPSLTPFSDITASSQFGISGTVTLTTLNVDPSRGLLVLPSDFVDSTQQIAQTCSAQERRNSFVVTGRGGLSADPSEALNQTRVWVDAPGIAQAAMPSPGQSAIAPTTLTEATGWSRNADGSIALVADQGLPPGSPEVPNCQSYGLGEP